MIQKFDLEKENKMKYKLICVLLIVIGMLFLSACTVIRPKEGILKELQGIYVITDLINNDLYAKLLPEPFSMPETPKVMVVITNYTDVANYMGMSPYQEGYVSLLCKYNGELGWHAITMPVTKWVPMKAGRAMGFPKYIADEITLNFSGNQWHGKVHHDGTDKLSLSFTENTSSKSSIPPQTENWLRMPVLQLLPSNEGFVVNRINTEQKIESSISEDAGFVFIKIDPKSPWAGLVSEDTSHPGVFLRMKCGIDFSSKRMN